MEQHTVKILSIGKVTHDVLKIVTEKPPQFTFIPGQATLVCINKAGCAEEKSPFTFTNLPADDQLEFTIKTYPARDGITNELLSLEKNDILILHEAFGAIAYKGEGVFIAGGAGVTPFISIFRQLRAKNETGDNKLIFANKTKADIILEEEFKTLLGKNFIPILSDEEMEGYAHGQITKEFLEANIARFDRQFYICGPRPMIDAVQKQLLELGADKKAITIEKL